MKGDSTESCVEYTRLSNDTKADVSASKPEQQYIGLGDTTKSHKRSLFGRFLGKLCCVSSVQRNGTDDFIAADKHATETIVRKLRPKK